MAIINPVKHVVFSIVTSSATPFTATTIADIISILGDNGSAACTGYWIGGTLISEYIFSIFARNGMINYIYLAGNDDSTVVTATDAGSMTIRAFTDNVTEA